jgi:hypothetical protein
LHPCVKYDHAVLPPDESPEVVVASDIENRAALRTALEKPRKAPLAKEGPDGLLKVIRISHVAGPLRLAYSKQFGARRQ